MNIRNTEREWGLIQLALHWALAVAAISQLVVGFRFGDLPEEDPSRANLFAIHTSLGLSIFVVMLFRLYWRLTNPVPVLPGTLSPMEKRLARANHWLFYVLLIGLPVGGYLTVSAEGHSIPFYGGELPPLLPESEALAEIIETAHVLGASLLAILIIVHVLAALRHAFMLRDGTLRRMLGTSLRPEVEQPSDRAGKQG